MMQAGVLMRPALCQGSMQQQSLAVHVQAAAGGSSVLVRTAGSATSFDGLAKIKQQADAMIRAQRDADTRTQHYVRRKVAAFIVP